MRTSATLAALAALGLLLPAALSACSGSALTGAGPADDAVGDSSTPTDSAVTPDGADAADAADTAVPADTAPIPDAADAGDTSTGPVAQWASRSLGDDGVLADVVAVSPTEAYAVGRGRALRYNGRGWAAWGEPGAESLHGVWAGDGQVFIVGTGGFAARRGRDEAQWTLTPTGTDVTLRGVYGRAADDVYAFGDDAIVLHWDGVSWTSEFSLAGIALYSAWIKPGTTGREGVYAVGAGGLLVKYEAGQWRTEQITHATSVLRDIFGVGDALFAVGKGATITVKKATAPTWQGQTSNDPRDRDLYAVVGRAADDVVAFGADGTVIRYDGSKWTVEAPTGPQYASAHLVSAAVVPGAAAESYLVVAHAGGGLRLDGDRWVDLVTRPAGGVRDFAGGPDGHVCAVGTEGLMVLWGDQGWSSVPLPVDVDLNGVVVDAAGTGWSVGEAGTIVRMAADGTVTLPDSGVPLELFGVAATSERVWVTGKGGTLLAVALDGSAVTLEPSGTASDLKAAAIGGDGALWLVGAFGTLLRKGPGDAVPVAIGSGVGGSLNDVVATSGGVLVVGDNGVVLDATASGATLRHEAPGLFLFGAAASGAVELAVGWSGTVLRRVGDAFEAEVSGASGVLQAVWTDGTRAIAGGRDGMLLERLEAP